jgi:hypothetical protein
MASTPNPFAGITGGVRSEDIVASEHLRIAIIGKPKAGKSWLAATARKPMLYYDFDNRAESLEGKQGILVKTVNNMLDVETDLSVMKANKIKKFPLPATIVFDSVTYMNKAMEMEIFRQDPKLARSIRVGNNVSVKLRNGWDVINGVQRYIEYLIAEISPLADLIFVFHERSEKDYSESTPDKTAYTDQITVDPQYLSKALSLFNEVYRIKVDGNRKYEVSCRPNWDINASTTMLLDPTEPPDIMGMIKKHEQKRAALAPKQP